MSEIERTASVDRLIRIAVISALAGLVCVLLFLWQGFAAWSVGIGVFLGAPLLLIAMVTYVAAVVLDLRQRGAL